MNFFKDNVRASWFFFEASGESRSTIFWSRAMLAIIPALIGAGVFAIFLFTTLPIAALSGIASAVLTLVIMLRNDKLTRNKVLTYVESRDSLSDDEYYGNVSHIFDTSKEATPVFYQGVGEWVSYGHVPLHEFVSHVLEIDMFLSTIPEDDLIDSVQYKYAIVTESQRTGRPTLRIVAKGTPDALKITRLKAPFDYYISHPDDLQSSASPTPNPIRDNNEPVNSDSAGSIHPLHEPASELTETSNVFPRPPVTLHTDTAPSPSPNPHPTGAIPHQTPPLSATFPSDTGR